MRALNRLFTISILMLAAAVTQIAPALAQNTLPAEIATVVDSAAIQVLARTGAPSASVAVIRHGEIEYTKAFGQARLDPPMEASPAMRYSIGSISKQFTAAAILLLAERGKLTLDDKVSRWLPELTRADEVTVRQILSMTSGYQDYWPEDYVMPPMLLPTTARQIVDGWARKPLDFDPGTKWQYSNTNYVIAGLIVEEAAGMSLVSFLQQEVFTKLGLESVVITDEGALGPGEPMRYRRFALGPAREAPKEGPGWMFAAGELAMTATDLAKWDLSVIDQTILKPASYREQQTEVRLADGVGTGYGLGVDVDMQRGHRLISHTGEVSGFTAANMIYPDEGAGVVVLVNLDATGAASQIARRIADALFTINDAESRVATEQARAVFEGFQQGKIDRSLFSDNANAYFSDQALADFGSSLGSLGPPTEFRMTRQALRGGMTYRGYEVRCGNHVLRVSTFVYPDGRLEQFQVAGL